MQSNETKKVDVKKEEIPVETKVTSFDEKLDYFVKENLAPWHGILSEKTIKTPDADLDLAADKIAQAMTALQRRSKERRKKGSYGQE